MLLLLLLVWCDNAADAGAAYREAEEAFRDAHYEVALRKLQEALRLEPRETDRLLFRDRHGRQNIAYHPHWMWAKTCEAQAGLEKNPRQRIPLLREALTHLELSDFASAKERVPLLRLDLSTLEKASAVAPDLDPALTLLRTEVTACLDQERFEEALELASKQKALLAQSPAGRDLVETIERRLQAVLARYDRAMTLALETVALASPQDKADATPLLEAALVPPNVLRSPGPRVRWHQDFIALYKARLPWLKQQNAVKVDDALEAAQAFDDAAGKALDAGVFPGFRASSHLADAIRESRLAALWGPGNDTRLEPVLIAIEAALKSRKDRLATSLPRESAESYRVQTLAPLLLSCDKARKRLREGRLLDQQLHEWLERTRTALSDPATMSEPSRLRDLSKEEILLEQRPRWDEAAPELLAQVLFARSVLDLVAGILLGDSAELLREQAGARIRKARGIDPAVDAAWKDRLSPKVRSYLP